MSRYKLTFAGAALVMAFILLAACRHSAGDRSRAARDSYTLADTSMLASDSLSGNDDESAPGDTISFALVGDVMMGTTFPDSINGTYLPPDGGRHLFDECRELLLGADIAAGNLEGTFLDGPGQKRKMTNPDTYYLFRMPTSYVWNLVDAGFDFMGLANNHINDFGKDGHDSNMMVLEDAGIARAGLKGRCESAYLIRKNLRIGLTQFGHGDHNLDVTDLSELSRVVKVMRDSADIVVVSFHGGAEGKDCTHVPFGPEVCFGEKRGDVAAFARAAVDAGADIVFGHGPHVPRGVELYNDRIILYSLGNFCTPSRVSITGASGYAPLAVVRVDAEGRFIDGRIHSFKQHPRQGPKADSGHSAARLIRQLTLADFPHSPLSISEDGALTPLRR